MNLSTDKKERKEMPIASGVLAYFPNAIAEVAHVSFVGNQQHNPGQPMHWNRHKSTDHSDCVARHLLEHGTIDNDGLRHTAKLAWRALALLQVELENSADIPSGNPITNFPEDQVYTFTSPVSANWHSEVRDEAGTLEAIAPLPETNDHIDLHKILKLPPWSIRQGMLDSLNVMGCPPASANQIVGGTSFTQTRPSYVPLPWAYIAGPMRGKPKFNFSAFDAARDALLAKGYHVISPADIDRASHPNADDTEKADTTDQTKFVFRDFWSLYFLRKHGENNAIVLLDGWPRSIGASAEYFLSRWLGLKVLNDQGDPYVGNPTQDFAIRND